MWPLGDPLFGFPSFAGILFKTLVVHPTFSLRPSHFAIFDGRVVAFQVAYLHVATTCNVHGFIVNFILHHSSASP
jgi:hypothetical protein